MVNNGYCNNRGLWPWSQTWPWPAWHWSNGVWSSRSLNGHMEVATEREQCCAGEPSWATLHLEPGVLPGDSWHQHSGPPAWCLQVLLSAWHPATTKFARAQECCSRHFFLVCNLKFTGFRWIGSIVLLVLSSSLGSLSLGTAWSKFSRVASHPEVVAMLWEDREAYGGCLSSHGGYPAW